MTWTAATFSYGAVQSYCSGLMYNGLEPCCTYDPGIVFGASSNPACANWGTSEVAGGTAPQSVTLCPGSCQGDGSCNGIGNLDSNVIIDLGYDACQGGAACQDLGKLSSGFQGSAPHGKSIVVRDEACSGSWACYGTGDTIRQNVEIGCKSCHEQFACAQAARHGQSLLIEEDSCNVGNGACNQMAEWSNGPVHIKKQSCKEMWACKLMGRLAKGSGGVTVGERSCLGTTSCNAAGAQLITSGNTVHTQVNDGSIETNNDSCVASISCRECGAYMNNRVELFGTTTCQFNTVP